MQGNGSLTVEIRHQEKAIQMRSEKANLLQSCTTPLS